MLNLGSSKKCSLNNKNVKIYTVQQEHIENENEISTQVSNKIRKNQINWKNCAGFAAILKHFSFFPPCSPFIPISFPIFPLFHFPLFLFSYLIWIVFFTLYTNYEIWNKFQSVILAHYHLTSQSKKLRQSSVRSPG